MPNPEDAFDDENAPEIPDFVQDDRDERDKERRDKSWEREQQRIADKDERKDNGFRNENAASRLGYTLAVYDFDYGIKPRSIVSFSHKSTTTLSRTAHLPTSPANRVGTYLNRPRGT